MKKTILWTALLLGMSGVANATGSSVLLYGSVDIGLETVNWRNVWPFDIEQDDTLPLMQFPNVRLDPLTASAEKYQDIYTVRPTQHFWGIRVPASVVNPSIGNIFGVKGTFVTPYQINGFFEIETNPPAVTSQFTAFWNKAFVGVETPFGSLSFGAQDTATKSSSYNPLQGFNIRNLDTIGQAAGFVEPSIKYVTPSLNGLTLAASYAWNGLRTFDWSTGAYQWDIDNVNDTFWHLSLGAKFDDGGSLKLGLTYDQKYFKSFTGHKPAVNSYAFTIGGGYDFEHLRAFARYGLGDKGFGTTVDEALYNLGTFVFNVKGFEVDDQGHLKINDKDTKAGNTQTMDLALIDDQRASHRGGSVGLTFHIADGHDLSFVDQFGTLTQKLAVTEVYPVAKPLNQTAFAADLDTWVKSTDFGTWYTKNKKEVNADLGVSAQLSDAEQLKYVTEQMSQVSVATQKVTNLLPDTLAGKYAWPVQWGGDLVVTTNIVKVVYQWYMDANTTFYAYGNYGVSKAIVKKDSIEYPVMKQHVTQGGVGFSYRF